MIVGFAVAACEVPIVAILVVVLMYRKRKFPCLSRQEFLSPYKNIPI